MRATLCVILFHAALTMARKLPASGEEGHVNVFHPGQLEKFINGLMNEFSSNEPTNERTANNTVERRDGDTLLNEMGETVDSESLQQGTKFLDMELFQDGVDLGFEPPPKSKSSKDDKGGSMMIPILIGFKVTAFVVGVVSIIGLLILKAFIASKAALIIALILGLKKVFGEHDKSSYKAVHAPSHYEPEFHFDGGKLTEKHANNQQDQDHSSHKFNGYETVPEQETLAFLAEHPEINVDLETFESQNHQGGPEFQVHENVHLPHHDSKKLTHDDHQKRRTWKTVGKRRATSIAKSHQTPVITYRKAVTGRNL